MYYVIEYDGLRKIMDVKHDMQTELQNQRFPSALADLMKTGDMYVGENWNGPLKRQGTEHGDDLKPAGSSALLRSAFCVVEKFKF